MTDLVIQPDTLVVEVGLPGPPGKDGRDGSGFVSAHPENRLVIAPDDGYYVPELMTDPLAYYILARS